MSHDPNYFFSDTDKVLTDAVSHAGYDRIAQETLTIDAPQTAESLGAESWIKFKALNPAKTQYKLILINAGGHKIETAFIIARAVKLLEPDGQIIIAGANDTGGKSISKLLDNFGLGYTQNHKRKHQIYRVDNFKTLNQKAIDNALTSGDIQKRDDGFYTMAGVFAWDKIDTGTKILMETIRAENLCGRGADYGAGIGILGDYLLKNFKTITRLESIEIDARAIACAKKNLEIYKERSLIHHADATNFTPQETFDFIITNPPFHKGKSQDIKLGQTIILNALKALKISGNLYIVANATLPYEIILAGAARSVIVIHKAQGFKILKVTK